MHNFLKNLTRGGIVTALLGTLLLVLMPSSAQAYTYDGKDPSATGCGSDARTVHSARMVNPRGYDFGVIELRYSLNCHTAWARLTLDSRQWNCGDAAAGYACSTARIVRNNDGRAYGCTIYEGQTQCYTAMVYDKGLTAYAQGTVDAVSGMAIVRTASY
jgi:hypothetical protein